MERLVVTGGTRLTGSVKINGAKNAILPLLASSLLSEKRIVLEGVPSLNDVYTMKEALESLGIKIKWEGDTMEVDPSDLQSLELSPSLARRMRASNLVMGPLLGRCRKFKVSYPGGCTIGSRPMDLHLKGFSALGAEITDDHGCITAEAPVLQGADIHLDFPSVGATENIMMAAVLAQGTTMIKNAAREPEIIELQNFLNKLGARIRGAGTDTIRIDGVKKLNQEISHGVISDRIETGTFMTAAAITGGEVWINNVIPEHVKAITAKLREAGVSIKEEDDRIFLNSPSRWRAVDIRTMPYPGFPTDMQPQMMIFLALAQGTSIITETIFENRYLHVGELRRMGAQVRVEGKTAVITGVPQLTGTTVEATDLRAGAALVVGGLAAENTTVIEGIEHLDRGYERLENRLSMLGAKIQRQQK
ncbi:MAG: UDP-N-acetylglucosamine 1-carboxyvinyltransferase [Syntrophaceticus sp.]|nr:UDP-N-acetylglucosamine 1-carboxyvinyltransferase [Syntrophaceticus sp.]MDD3314186.1 UDP-N-acetylglucosamine 1-carboxyvinyltransferase [Syntrophaceticus sp.]MDD4359370.1 UDP-N-acetylglucosamine 1-carboxyvinyltransferase [Syntrophaceticus sp.]MDD4782458.1 UDP-N-acetylglucosamine 1-carboxyvinyltransferase [Syntrophaceticus sp.]HBI26816.1 UDP-N-acetylglucosamine 1-carboxyvinyltransferase [Peptococcaceae bacterium]